MVLAALAYFKPPQPDGATAGGAVHRAAPAASAASSVTDAPRARHTTELFLTETELAQLPAFG
jgi:hypothetical protein